MINIVLVLVVVVTVTAAIAIAAMVHLKHVRILHPGICQHHLLLVINLCNIITLLLLLLMMMRQWSVGGCRFGMPGRLRWYDPIFEISGSTGVIGICIRRHRVIAVVSSRTRTSINRAKDLVHNHTEGIIILMDGL